MLRKKEKKAIASIFALLIGWPIGLDLFVEGVNTKGIQTFIAWSLIAAMFLTGFSMNLSGGDGFSVILFGLIVSIIGGVLATVKLVKLL
tara:strand:- start:295 stop:561 length:267 start_codon:yes stop_codon:yes gene_type:complete